MNDNSDTNSVTPSIFCRLTIAGLVFVIFELVFFAMAFYVYQGPDSWLRYNQVQTFRSIKGKEQALREYQEKNGKFPLSLEELEKQKADAWGNPFQYQSDGQHWTLVSLGADGKEGGIGLNSDLTVTDTDNITGDGFHKEFFDRCRPTFQETIRCPDLQSVMVILSLLLLVVTIFQIVRSGKTKEQKEEKKNGWKSVLAGIAILLMSLFMIHGLITVLSIPSGH